MFLCVWQKMNIVGFGPKYWLYKFGLHNTRSRFSTKGLLSQGHHCWWSLPSSLCYRQDDWTSHLCQKLVHWCNIQGSTSFCHHVWQTKMGLQEGVQGSHWSTPICSSTVHYHWLWGSYVAGTSMSTTNCKHPWLLLSLDASCVEKGSRAWTTDSI